MTEGVWQKSSFSGEAANCLNVAAGSGGRICVRESDEPGAVFAVTGKGMRSFMGAVKEGWLLGELGHVRRTSAG